MPKRIYRKKKDDSKKLNVNEARPLPEKEADKKLNVNEAKPISPDQKK